MATKRLTPAGRVNRVLMEYLPAKSSAGARAKLRAAFWSGASVGAVADRLGIAGWRGDGVVRDLRALDHLRRVENPDWAAVRAKAKHHGTRAWEATKSTAKRAGAAAKRGTKKAAPHVARGFRSLSARLDRYAENPSACTCPKPKRKRSR